MARKTIYVELKFDFEAYIDVYAPDGTELTLTDGVDTITKNLTGDGRFTIRSPGWWDITATWYGEEQEQTVYVAESGEVYEVEFDFDFEAYIVVTSAPGVTLTLDGYSEDFTAQIVVKSHPGWTVTLSSDSDIESEVIIYSLPGITLTLN